jgi:hypothetical protein
MAKKILRTSKKLKKYEDGGMAGKGPLQPAPKKEKTAAELAQEKIASLSSIPGVTKTALPGPVKETLATTPKAKLLPGGFKDQVQKDAYIKNTKNLLKTKSIDDLVKMKHGTRAGLEALGFKDSKVNRAEPETPLQASKINYNNKKAKELKVKGLELKQKGKGMKVAGQVLKGFANEKSKTIAQRLGLPESKGLTKFVEATKDLITPVGIVKYAPIASNAIKVIAGGKKLLPAAEKLLPAAKKLLKSGKPLLNSGQKMLPTVVKKSSNVVSKLGVNKLKTASNSIKSARTNVTTKLSKGIKTNNPVAREMKLADKKAALFKQQKGTVKKALKDVVKERRNPQTKLKLK